jgi:small-conductance mechanosensitive channel
MNNNEVSSLAQELLGPSKTVTNSIINIFNKISGKTNNFITKEESDNEINPFFAILLFIFIIVIYYVMYYYAMKFVCASGMNVGEYFLAMCCTLPYVIIKLLMGSSNKSKSV